MNHETLNHGAALKLRYFPDLVLYQSIGVNSSTEYERENVSVTLRRQGERFQFCLCLVFNSYSIQKHRGQHYFKPYLPINTSNQTRLIENIVKPSLLSNKFSSRKPDLFFHFIVLLDTTGLETVDIFYIILENCKLDQAIRKIIVSINSLIKLSFYVLQSQQF